MGTLDIVCYGWCVGSNSDGLSDHIVLSWYVKMDTNRAQDEWYCDWRSVKWQVITDLLRPACENIVESWKANESEETSDMLNACYQDLMNVLADAIERNVPIKKKGSTRKGGRNNNIARLRKDVERIFNTIERQKRRGRPVPENLQKERKTWNWSGALRIKAKKRVIGLLIHSKFTPAIALEMLAKLQLLKWKSCCAVLEELKEDTSVQLDLMTQRN